MRTPAGKECPYFYGDYFRGRQQEECRLLQRSAPDQRWTADLCAACPVPDIARANSCEHQQLYASIKRNFPFLKRQVVVRAYCHKSQQEVNDPHIGCGQCHPNLEFIIGVESDPDPSA